MVTIADFRRSLQLGRNNAAQTSEERAKLHISSIDPKLRKEFDQLFYNYVVKRFEELSGKSLSREWRKIKGRFARNAAAGKRMRNKPHPNRWYDEYYRERVTPSIAKPIRLQNIDTYGQASGFLRNTILDVLEKHRNMPESFSAVIEYAKVEINGKQETRPRFTFTLKDSFFAREYPRYLAYLISGGDPNILNYLLPHPSHPQYAIFLDAAHDALQRLMSAAASLSGLQGLIRSGSQ